MGMRNTNALTPSDIGLILSYRCQANCAHCIYNCGKSYHDWMTPEEVRLALSQARSVWGRGFQAHLTGGEPFLNFPLLLESTKIAVELGIPVYLETNVGWCGDLVRAEDRFRQLREAGMGMVLVSVSPFHQEYIPLRRTLDGISAARAAFGKANVFVYQSEWLPEMAKWDQHEMVSLEQYEAAYGREQAGLRFWMGFGVVSGGRAGYRLGGLIPKKAAEAFSGEDCAYDMLHAQHSHMDVYGNFIPSSCAGIRLGSWRELDAVVSQYRQGKFHPVVALLIDEGPFGLYQWAMDEYDYHPLDGGYAGKCHLCVDVRRHLVAVGIDQDILAPQAFYEAF